MPKTEPNETAEIIRGLAQDQFLLHIVHCRLEDMLIEMRDSRTSILPAANGLVVKEADGTPSDVIRLPTRMAVKFALEAIADYLDSAPEVHNGS